MTGAPPARHSRAFWRRFLRHLSKPCVPSFSTICSVVQSCRRTKPGVWWIERETPGWSLTLMGHVKRPGNARCLRRKTCPRPFADWMRCVLLATLAASGGKSYELDRHQPGAQLPMARQFWQQRQRTLPKGTAPGTLCHHALPHSTPAPARANSAAARRPIWDRSCAH